VANVGELELCSICGQDDKYVSLGWDGDMLMHYDDGVKSLGNCGAAQLYAERDRLKAELADTNKRLETLVAVHNWLLEFTDEQQRLTDTAIAKIVEFSKGLKQR
jgi:hypothetical protein